MDPVLIPSTPRAASSPMVRVLLLVGIASIPVLATVRPFLDEDIWWHLRTGEWIVNHGWPMSHDPFSQGGEEKNWIAYSWLFEITAYQLYQWFGLPGIVLLRLGLALTVLATFFLLARRREPRTLVVVLMMALITLTMIGLFRERPWLGTILGTTLTMLVVLDFREGRAGWSAWLLPLLFVVWANWHIQFIYGLLLLGLACVAPIFDRVLRIPSTGHADTFASRDWYQLLALTLGCTLATLVTPYHLRLYGVILEYATQPLPFQIVNELMAMTFRRLWDWLVLGTTLIIVFRMGQKGKLSTFEILWMIFSVILCFRARRDLWLVLLTALVVLPRWGLEKSALPEPEAFTSGESMVGGFGILVVVAGLWQWQQLSQARLEEQSHTVYPWEACQIVKKGLARGEIHGPLYNHFNWGGYLIWELPELPVAVDGRTNLQGEERLARFYNTYRGLKGWADDPDLARAGVVILDSESALASLLRLDSRFVCLHEDSVGIVFVPARK